MLADLKLENSGDSDHTFLSGQVAHVTHRPVDSYRETSPVGSAPHETHPCRVRESLEEVILIHRSLHSQLKWWLQELNVLQGQPLHPLSHTLQIFLDASREGWGTSIRDLTARLGPKQKTSYI